MSQEAAELFSYILQDVPNDELDREFPFYPLTAPGMSLPGKDFLRQAIELGDAAPTIIGKGQEKRLEEQSRYLHYLYRRALYDEQFKLNVEVKGNLKLADFVPGHLWGYDTRDMTGGPRQARVMVLGKCPGVEEIQHGRNFVGPTSEEFHKTLQTLGITDGDTSDWYITNLCKFPQLDSQSSALAADWIKDCAPLLDQELRLVRPDFILCLGSESSKYLLGSTYSVTSMVGRVMEYRFPVRRSWADPESYHTAKVMTALHPAAVFRKPELSDEFQSQLGLFWQLINGGDVGNDERDIDHDVIYKERTLKQLVDQMLADPRPDANIIAVDAEWHGEYPGEPGAYLRTIQISNRDKWARTIVLRHQGGESAFVPSIEHAMVQLRRLCKNTPTRRVRIGGHFLRADMPWLINAGLDLREEYAPHPDSNVRDQGGWDTSLAYHAYNETARYKLEDMATRLTTAPRYDAPLQAWKKDYCATRKMKVEDLEGYGQCPDEILHPYACLHGDSLVQLSDGTWKKIGWLVKHRYAGFVKAVVNGRVVDARVTNWHRHDVRQKEWLRLRTASAKFGRWGLLGPLFTPDHEILTQRGKVMVEQLVPGADCIVTDELQFSAEQLQVCLGCLVGDGGFTRQNNAGVGFGFGQRAAAAEYANWKAACFANFNPALRQRYGQRRYELPFSRYLRQLADLFPTHPVDVHGHRKAVITEALLHQLGDRGLAVWYQDDGTLAGDNRCRSQSSRIYCTLPADEQRRVVDWLTAKFGDGVSYNQNSRFFQITGEAFTAFHAAINPFMHPAMTYKTPLPVGALAAVPASTELFHEPILEVVPWNYAGPRRGNGVRYCLTVEGAGNFLTQAGFVSNCYDADVTRRAIMRLLGPRGDSRDGLLARDWFGNDSWLPYWISHSASLAFLEMEMTGFAVDRKRADEMSRVFMAARDRMVAELQQELNWPSFNPKSHPQCAAMLFGDAYGCKIDKVTRQKIPCRPAGARTLNLQPVKSTGKRPKLWADLMARRQTEGHTPSTDKEVLGILGHNHPEAAKLRDIKFITQVMQSVLRPPVRDEVTGELETDEDGNYTYEKGLMGSVLADGRVHTHLFQTKETGRASSARPPLQNISSRREDDYRRILGDAHQHPIRSILCVPPGYVGIDADLTGAELAVLAWLCQDRNMIEHVFRNNLPEDHPDHYDIHAQQACRTFRLTTVRPTKTGMKDAGVKGLRVAAKNVNFGIPYGRGAEAIARQCAEEGVDVTEEQCQAMIDAYFESYPGTWDFLKECRDRSQDPGFIVGPYGRIRRFVSSSDRQVVGEQERQAQNFPIQNGVADAVSIALANFMQYRREHPELDYRIMLQIHDAIVLLVPIAQAERVYKEVMRTCMVDRVPFWPRRLDGSLMEHITEPYRFGVDMEVFTHWGEKLKGDKARELGLDWLAA